MRVLNTSAFKTIALCLTLALGSTGCFSVGAYTRTVAPAESHHFWVHGFFWGLVGSDLDMDTVCGGRPMARVDTYMSMGNVVVSYLTGGIYTPMSLEVTCGQPTAPAAQ